ncbi:MAG: hypothetical protein JNK07_12380 [Alphaproteobacteria bacterium]|nr:hypothetical protein [Alphaproteobacteria bacterium]
MRGSSASIVEWWRVFGLVGVDKSKFLQGASLAGTRNQHGVFDVENWKCSVLEVRHLFVGATVNPAWAARFKSR